MSLGESLTAVLASGAEASAARLSEITDNPWTVDGAAFVDSETAIADLLAGVAPDAYGSHITFPGGSFLLLYSGKSAYLIATAFTRDIQERVEGLHKREILALGEVSNILLNPLMGHLAKAWGTPLIISAPKTGIASTRDHLTTAVSRYKNAGKAPVAVRLKLASRNLFSECALLLFLDPDFAAKIGGK